MRMEIKRFTSCLMGDCQRARCWRFFMSIHVRLMILVWVWISPIRCHSAPAVNYRPVITPNGSTLPYEMDGDVKVFHLIAEVITREFTPGFKVNCWGYNGQTPGPTIEAVEGDRVRILVTNNLPEPTAIHWHGLFLPNGMDGVGGLTQPYINPGETFKYEFPLIQHGTFMYHPHADEATQIAMGMEGFFVIHPRAGEPKPIDRDYAIFLHMWQIKPGTFTPNPNAMLDFNYFSFNSRVYPGTAPLFAVKNERVRIRIANLSMDSHPIHIHGVSFKVTATEGGDIPESAQEPTTTVDVPPGTVKIIEFNPTISGDWPTHCHKTHHAMNAMEHHVPNMIGVKQDDVERKINKMIPEYMNMSTAGMHAHSSHQMPGPINTPPMMAGEGPFGPINMGGMFTVLKVRDSAAELEKDEWYRHAPGTVASNLNSGKTNAQEKPSPTPTAVDPHAHHRQMKKAETPVDQQEKAKEKEKKIPPPPPATPDPPSPTTENTPGQPLVIDDFSGNIDSNGLRMRANIYQQSPSSIAAAVVRDNANANRSSVLQLRYVKKTNSAHSNRGGWCGYYSLLANAEHNHSLDGSRYRYLSLWLKGESGDENFIIKLTDRQLSAAGKEATSRPIIEYLPGKKMTRAWQQIKIPLADFPVDLTQLMSLTIAFEANCFPEGNGSGTLFIDTIALEP